MKKVLVVTVIAIALSVSPVAFAWAGCGGGYCSGDNGGYGCYGFQGNNKSGSCCSITSYIQSAANCCLASMVDFFKGDAKHSAAPGTTRAQLY